MASAKSPFAERENLSGIYPVHNVRHLSGSDPDEPLPPERPAGPVVRGRFRGNDGWTMGAPWNFRSGFNRLRKKSMDRRFAATHWLQHIRKPLIYRDRNSGIEPVS
jgi:hypothetical protein